MLLRNSFNGGTDGTAITTGNSGGSSGDAFTNITGTPTYVAAAGTRAPLAAEIGSNDSLAWRNITLAGREIWVRLYVQFGSLPSADDWFFELNFQPTSGSPTAVGRLMVGPTGTISYRRTTSAVLCSIPSAVTAGQWVRIELRVLIGTTTSNGAADLWVYQSVEASTTPLQASVTGVNANTTLPNEAGFVYMPGVVILMDDVAATDQGKLGPAYPAVIVQPASTAEQAQPITRRKRRTLGQPASLETTAPIRPVKRRVLGQAVEADTVLPMLARKVRTIGAAHESGSAAPVRPAHRIVVGQAGETDQAFVISNGTFVGTAAETDQALPVTPVKVRLLGPALDASMAAAVRPGRARTIGAATETDAVAAVGRRKIRVVALATEGDQARPLRLLGRDVTGVDGPRRTWSATLARRWGAEPPRRTWSASRT
ncbi:hypothetical protein [Nonomuraea sp. SYSU D8015]|uniref:hypothetical protein n=1 Tax=Nonomuraea sp. SYSU D8015 TaxID=2593644 RepID=UPI0016603C14|nr:hypothetical protein [Nonomuraea sp. SYSU D8015]